MKYSNIILTLITLFCAGSSFGQHKKIDKGKIFGDFSIEFVKEHITLVPDTFFRLSELKLTENEYNKKYLKLTELDWALEKFEKGEIKAYDILIKKPNIAKPFYGKIAFFDAMEDTQKSPVSRYYEISIDSKYFDSATRGRIASVFEYSDNHKTFGGMGRFKITWVLLMSDEPF